MKEKEWKKRRRQQDRYVAGVREDEVGSRKRGKGRTWNKGRLKKGKERDSEGRKRKGGKKKRQWRIGKGERKMERYK